MRPNARLDDAKAAYQALAKRSPKSADGVKARIRHRRDRVHAEERCGCDEGHRRVCSWMFPMSRRRCCCGLVRRLKAGKTDEAIADLRIVTRKEPENVTALLVLAEAHQKKNEPAVAKDIYRQVLRLQPDSAVALGELVEPARRRPGVCRCRTAVDRASQGSGRMMRRPHACWSICCSARARRTRLPPRHSVLAALPSQDGLGNFSMGRVLAEQRRLRRGGRGLPQVHGCRWRQ